MCRRGLCPFNFVASSGSPPTTPPTTSAPPTTTTLPTCTPPCENGGLCNNGYCQCPTGWGGARCQEGMVSWSREVINWSHCWCFNHIQLYATHHAWMGETVLHLTLVCVPMSGRETTVMKVSCCQYKWPGVVKGESSFWCCHVYIPLAVCFLPRGCEHGGVCVAPGHCSCSEGWTGHSCDEGSVIK